MYYFCEENKDCKDCEKCGMCEESIPIEDTQENSLHSISYINSEGGTLGK